MNSVVAATQKLYSEDIEYVLLELRTKDFSISSYYELSTEEAKQLLTQLQEALDE